MPLQRFLLGGRLEKPGGTHVPPSFVSEGLFISRRDVPGLHPQ